MREKVLLVDDDIEFAGLAQTWLQDAGYDVLTEENGKDGLRRVYSSRPNLVILNTSVPDMDGYEICHRIREMSEIPVIMVTSNGRVSDLLRGFNLGADDYMNKPLDFSELVARVAAVLRRCNMDIQEEVSESFRNGEVEIDWRSHQVYVRGETVKLSPTEFKLLSCLVRNEGRVLPHRYLLTEVWGPEYADEIDYVKLYVRYLRLKIEEDPSEPVYIQTEWGVGYRFSEV